MTLELQQIPPTELPVCPQCGQYIISHAWECTSPTSAYRMTREEVVKVFGATALPDPGKLDSER